MIVSQKDKKKKKNLSKRLRDLALGITLGYIVFVALLFAFQRHMQYMPDLSMMPLPQETMIPEMEQIFATARDGLDNQSWLFIPSKMPARIIIFFHGNASNLAGRADKARAMIDAGYGVMLVGYRGYENNAGTPTQEGIFSDARAAIVYVRDTRHIPIENMVFYGESLGSGVAVQMASEFPKIAGLILDVPFDSALHVAAARYPFVVGLSYLMKDPYRNDLLAPHLKMPKLIVAAEKDEIIHPSHARRLFDLFANPKEFIEIQNARHLTVYAQGGFKPIQSFLSRVVPVEQQGETSSSPPEGERALSSSVVVFTRADKYSFPVQVEIARTPAEQSHGLMGRTNVPAGRGMLFAFSPPKAVKFWMKDTSIPLDIIFLNKEGRIIKIHPHARPMDESAISSGGVVAAVVEMAGGQANALGIRVGDYADLTPFFKRK